MMRSIKGAVAGMMVSLLLPLGWILLPASPARAVSCGYTQNVAWYQTDDFHRGVRVTDMSTWDHNNPDNAPDGSTNVTCSRVSTLDVFHSDTQQMEIGWHITPNNSGVCPIDTAHPQLPYFTIIKTAAGGQTCKYSGSPLSLSAPATHGMKENDPYANGNWDFSLDGSTVGDTTSTPWSSGWVIVNTELHDSARPPGDSAHGKFVGLLYFTSSGSTSWTSTREFVDSDNYYYGSLINLDPSQVIVQQN